MKEVKFHHVHPIIFFVVFLLHGIRVIPSLLVAFFILLDTRDKSFIAARDAIGITPLYLGWGHDGMWLLL